MLSVLLYITGSLFYSVQIMTICGYYHLGDSCIQSKKKGKDQEPIQSSTKTDPMDTNGKVTTSQLDITNEGQEVSPFPAGDHKASINRRRRKHNKKQDRNNINVPLKRHRLGTVNKIFYWRA